MLSRVPPAQGITSRLHSSVNDEQSLPKPPIPADTWMQQIIANPDVEGTKLLVLIGILDSLVPDRRTRIMQYLNERFKGV